MAEEQVQQEVGDVKQPNPVENVVDDGKIEEIQIHTTIDLAKLPEHERIRIEHQRLHLKHKGHEAMHMEMILVLLMTLFVAQIFLVQWKKRHFKSYQTVTLFGMWIIPVLFCIKLDWWRFIYIWVIWSIINAVISYKATRKLLPGTTPRLVYRWFNLIYKASYALGVGGYLVIMCTLFGLNLLFMIRPDKSLDFGFLLIFYGLYYGVLGRDFAEICSESMASHIGYYKKIGLPDKALDGNICAICGLQMVIPFEEDETAERIYELTCNHRFHEYCIRGWCIVGKKQTCPYCKEKVDLKRMFKNFWERPHVLYGQLLDWIRYLVVWQPVIFLLVQGINYILGLE